MNINLVYEGKDYNFDIPNNVTIDYIKELSSKIFNSDKALLDLIYNNSKFTDKDDSILLRDLIPEGENNAVLTVQVNKNINKSISKKNSKKKIKENKENRENKENINSKEKEKEKEIKDYNFIGRMKKKIKIEQKLDRINENDEKIILNENDEKISIEPYNKINKGDNKKTNDYNIIKKFDSTLSKKSGVLLSLIKEFNSKVKEIYLYLFKKCQKRHTPISNSPRNNDSTLHFSSSDTSRSSKNDQNINNNYIYELVIFEKKLINFQENQIQFYLKLLDLLKKYDKDDIMITLNEFYNKLIPSNSSNIKNDHLDFIQPMKFKKMASYKLLNNTSSNSNNFTSLNSIKKKLPFLINKNSNNNSNSNISLIEKKKINFNVKSNEEISSYKNKIFNKSTIEKGEEKVKKSMFSKDKLKTISDNNNIISDSKENKNNDIKNKNTINKISHKMTYNGIKFNFKFDEKSEKNNNKNNNSNIEEIASSNNSEKNIIKQSPTQIFRNKTFKPFKNNFSDKNIINIINNNNKKRLEKMNHKFNRYNSLNNLNNFKFSPYNDKTSKCEEIINTNTKKDIQSNQATNDFEEYKKKGEEFFPKMSRIKDIDVSSITINTSNFIRDKQILFKKKKRKSMSKFDFMI